MKSPDIEFHIDELILHGFPSRDRQRIGDALEQELTALFAERGAPARISQSGAAASLDAGEFQVAANADAQTVSTELATAIYDGLSR
jgi:hypothetical protein